MAVFSKPFRYVITLANEGSFSRAADVLNIKQPSLSQYIRKIESDVGADLFDRTGGSVRLTDAGLAYIEIGQRVLNLERELEGRLSDISSFNSGTITIGISAHRSAFLLPAIIKEFKEKYPGIIVKIEEQKRCDILESAEHGDFDIFITTLPVDEKLFDFQTVLIEENIIAAPSYIDLLSEIIEGKAYPAVSARTFDGYGFVMLNDEHPMQMELEELCCEHNLSLKKILVCTSLEALLKMVEANVGFALIPSCMAEKNADIKYYSIKEWDRRREIVLAYRKGQYLSAAVKDFISTIKSQFNNGL